MPAYALPYIRLALSAAESVEAVPFVVAVVVMVLIIVSK